MSKKQVLSNYQDVIPATARAIKITNIQDPYIMKAYEIEKHVDNIDKIGRKLLEYAKTDDFFKRKNDTTHPKIGDEILIQSSNLDGMLKLPAYFCRGFITRIKEEHKKYNILLVDHGNSIELSRDDFYIVPKDFIHEKYLTKTVGIYDILPIRMKNDTLDKQTADVVEEWSEEAIQFTKDLLTTSKDVYFNNLVRDEKGREFGEFYLTIDGIVTRLSEALVISYYAIYLEGDLLKLIENPNQYKDAMEEEIIMSIKFPVNRQINQKDIIQTFSKVDSYNTDQNRQKVLIYSKVRYGILSDVSDLRFPARIHKGWNSYINSSRPRNLQAYMWPPIKDRLNTVAIGPSQCGKTSGCIMSICGLIAMRESELPPKANYPLALILCASSVEADNIQTLCLAFLQNYNNIKSVAAFNGRTEISVAASIYNGCRILIATPRYLVRFLNNNKGVLSFDKLSFLILDNADVILNKYHNSLGELFKKYHIIDNRNPNNNDRPLLQMIILATKWTSDIKKFVSLCMYNPYICITSFIEAIIFKSVHPKIYITSSTNKNQQILDILKNDYTDLRTMVICVNAEEAEELSTFLRSTKKVLLIHEKMASHDVEAFQENWKKSISGLYPILICTDAVISDLNCTDIEWLIHYSVLLTLQNDFNRRFSVLLDNLTQETTNCRVTIIIDENNNIQLQSIIKILQRMHVVIPPNVLENIKRIEVTLEKNKKGYDICDNIKSFGFCLKQNACVFRHCLLSETDTPMTNMQINDKVKLKLMYIHNTTHLSARLIEHIPHSADSQKIKFPSEEYMKITFKMFEFYKNIENRKVCTSINVGDICVLDESLDVFKRVQIMHIKLQKLGVENVLFTVVRCIDNGIIHQRIDARRLLQIPEELRDLPIHIVEIFLVNTVPRDEEYTWSHLNTIAVHEWFSKNLNERSYIIGKVCLHLGNTIWLDDFKIGTELIGHDLVGSSLKKELISKNHAVSNPNHITDLYQLCKNSGLAEINGCNINSLCE